MKNHSSIFGILALTSVSISALSQVPDNSVEARHRMAAHFGEEATEFNKKLIEAKKVYLAGEYLRAEALCLIARDMHSDMRHSEYQSIGVLLGDIYLAEHSYDRAIEQYKLTKDGNYLPAYSAASIGTCYLRKGSVEDARAALLQISPGDGGRLATFIEDANVPDVANGSPAVVEATCYLIRAMDPGCTTKDDYQRRMDGLKLADKLLPHNEAITYLIGENEVYLGDFAKAREILQPIIKSKDQFFSASAEVYCRICTLKLTGKK